MDDGAWVQATLASWYASSARPLPWRDAATTPWGVLVSEFMSQQTPVARVEQQWREWMQRWPDPRSLAVAPTADVLRAWGRLGYPRRALRLQQAARVLADEHDNTVPADEDALLALPGVGRYTAAAVMAFAFGRRSVVLDTNVRRVLARVVSGVEFPARSESAAERALADSLVPESDDQAVRWSVSVMELGALVCTAQAPRCGGCPVAAQCAWLAAGRPAGERPVGQAWHGTNRQCRGAIMARLRASDEPVALAEVAWPDRQQLEVCAESLVADGLAAVAESGLTLPS